MYRKATAIQKMLIKINGVSILFVSLLLVLYHAASTDALTEAAVAQQVDDSADSNELERRNDDDSLRQFLKFEAQPFLDNFNSFYSPAEHKAAGSLDHQRVREKRLARFQSECMTDLDCPAGTCCIPTVGRNRVRECRRLRDTNELCHPHSKPTPFSGFRGFPLCPCTAQLECNKQSWKCEINLLKK